jgi:1-acyl-sn-glycerol-3-phosphate acyltransferase
MTPARRAGLGSAVVRWYVRAKVRGFFRGLWVKGEALGGDQPVLVYANHPGFWDGLVLHELATAWGREPFCMVEAQNLKRFPFLARLGAFSIRPGEPASTAESFRYARSLLERPRAALFVFPQGRLSVPGSGPLLLQRGVEVLARRSGVPCVPLALRYAFLDSERPDVLVATGGAHRPAPTSELTARLDERLGEVAGATSLEGFRPVVRGSPGVAARWESLKQHFVRGPRLSAGW